MAKEKARYFTFLLYPESIPADWLVKLELLGIPMAISPLHDKDKNKRENQKNGIYKKPHYHVIYIANNPVTVDSIRKKIQRALGAQSIAKVQIITTTVENTYLYLTHESKDSIAKNKHVYDSDDIILLNNFDIDRYISMGVEEKDDLFNVITKLIVRYQIANMIELNFFIEKYGRYFGLHSMKAVNKIVASKSTLLKIYFDGAYQTRRNGIRYIQIDTETGELINQSEEE